MLGPSASRGDRVRPREVKEMPACAAAREKPLRRRPQPSEAAGLGWKGARRPSPAVYYCAGALPGRLALAGGGLVPAPPPDAFERLLSLLKRNSGAFWRSAFVICTMPRAGALSLLPPEAPALVPPPVLPVVAGWLAPPDAVVMPPALLVPEPAVPPAPAVLVPEFWLFWGVTAK